MKKIIAVRGKSNVGKTGSIKKALELLRERYPLAIITPIKNQKDIIIKATIKDQVIIFASGGDTQEILDNMLKTIKNENVDILICATKSRGKTVRTIENCSLGTPIIWIEKNWSSSLESEQEAENRTIACEILDHIQIR